MFKIIYTILIYLYKHLIIFASPFSNKARLWLKGRRRIFREIKKLSSVDNIIWFHCSSLGEFEQGRTVIEKIKAMNKDYKILLTFFSPSGYEVRKNYEHADYVFYLPVDTSSNARKFVSYVNPVMVFFVKYDFWFNYIEQITKRGIPFYTISAKFRSGQYFFKPYGKYFLKRLKTITHIFVQDTNSYKLLKSFGINNVTVSGDTRFDRVYNILNTKSNMPDMEEFSKNSKVLICGSTWQKDEAFLIKFINSNQDKPFKYIIVPHEIHECNIEYLYTKIRLNTVRFSQVGPKTNINYYRVIIVDTIGHLSQLYRFSNVAYIGGGFGSGIHNTLEAVVYGIPVVFGPNYHKFKEACELLKIKGGFSIKNYKEFSNTILDLLSNNQKLEEIRQINNNFIANNIGATDKIINNIIK